MVVNAGGIAALLNVISCSEELSCAPAVMALGSIAALSPIIALAIIQSEVLIRLFFFFIFVRKTDILIIYSRHCERITSGVDPFDICFKKPRYRRLHQSRRGLDIRNDRKTQPRTREAY